MLVKQTLPLNNILDLGYTHIRNILTKVQISSFNGLGLIAFQRFILKSVT